MDGLVGRTFDRYEIVGLIGAGGMGKVYRAKDPQLNRTVAIKVIHDAEDEDSHRTRRFHREIRAVASLTHPNIVELHDFGCSDGFLYAVMELLKGKDLRQAIKGRPMAVERAIDIGVSVARGLGEAHHNGVLHRDIKPENIFLTSDGAVKILDFGLARPVIPSDPKAETVTMTESLTNPGTIVGTTGYQSPEQVRGQDLDPRSDVFALGCVLYEMLAGFNPYRRDTRVDSLSAILEHQPEPLTELRPELPPAIDLIVDRCLQKNPDQRFDSARDVAFALQAMSGSRSGPIPVPPQPVRVARRVFRWAGGAMAMVGAVVAGYLGFQAIASPELPENPHVAVVGFEAVGTGEDLDLLAAGFSDVVASDLMLLEDELSGDFWIVPPGVARSMGAVSGDDLYRLFNVNVVLTGSIEPSGSRLRLTMEAIDPRTGRTISEETIEDDKGNVSAFQSLPPQRVAEMLGLGFPGEVRQIIEGRATNVASAFDAFVRGRGILSRASGESDVLSAIGYLERSTIDDPVFPAAREALADAYRRAFALTGERVWLDRGLEEAKRVVQKRPSASSYRTLSVLHRAVGNYEDEAAALKSALELTPNSGGTRLLLGAALERLGQIEDAERELLLSANLRPGYWPVPNQLGYFYFSQGQQHAAANAWRQVVLSAPEYDGGYLNLGIVSHLMGRRGEARALYEKAIELAPDTSYDAYSNLGTIHFDEARFADAILMYEKALSVHDDDAGVWGSLGYSCAYSGQPQRAEEAFRHAIDLAEKERGGTADEDPRLLSDLAGYYAMVDARETSRELLQQSIDIGTKDIRVLATIGETFEDLGDRDQALVWIGRALEGGMSPDVFDSKPTLRSLVDDERYRQMVELYRGT